MLVWLSVWSEVAQLMPLPLTVSCFGEIQIGFTSLVPAHPGSPGKGAIKRLCVCVCVCVSVCELVYCIRGELSGDVFVRSYATTALHKDRRKWRRNFSYHCTEMTTIENYVGGGSH